MQRSGACDYVYFVRVAAKVDEQEHEVEVALDGRVDQRSRTARSQLRIVA